MQELRLQIPAKLPDRGLKFQVNLLILLKQKGPSSRNIFVINTADRDIYMTL